MRKQFEDFAISKFNLKIYSQGKIIFRSKKRGLKGLISFIKKKNHHLKNLIIFDKIIGNAAALLCVYLGAKKVYGVLGTKSAGKTFRKFKIKYYFKKIKPNILNKTETDICPLEKISFKKLPEEFYTSLKGK